ncbi:hypothetical protein RvVAT039_31480 [Agrobacterium vitis]|nr:hypothetical protein RvVAT039_31480 [Agrobacterium vitis]
MSRAVFPVRVERVGLLVRVVKPDKMDSRVSLDNPVVRELRELRERLIMP